ncbi:PMS1 family ATPase [Cryptosporidium ubiquitum]|uniref:PMS1 family ATPase n=1 Tax=Cryptosporidium ubiquitum TaxID=857276 RepID=A0A1J4MHZ2_9CRYT|nr:PMS1 family ATPase [Cryptosporidium ubiquitum]OII72453.1 PMS1 family ATPase [Cryptosporidium ubiquitum]
MLKKLSKEDQDRICSQQVITELRDCIKELVDNAIDAECTEILISLTDFGSSTIEVLDNGKGIEELNQIGERGATSKLESFDHINESLSTLGFRGEGLNSIINSCEIVEIDSKYGNEENKVVFEQGKCQIINLDEKDQGTNQFHKYHFSGKSGTRVKIVGLFLPYISRRSQFLKNLRLQLKSLIVLIEEYAICYPMIRFLLSNKILSDVEREKIHKRLVGSEIKHQSNQIQSQLIMTRGKVSSQKEVAQYIWGKSVLGNSLDFKLEGEVFIPKLQKFASKVEEESSPSNQALVGGKWIITGFISSLDKGRPSPDHQIFTVNSRPVDSIKRISRVISSIHSTLSSFNSRKLYPAFVINIQLPQALLDINVTPNKRIIMLPAKVETIIAESIQQFLQDSYQNNIPIKRESIGSQSLLNFSSKYQDTHSTETIQSQPSQKKFTDCITTSTPSLQSDTLADSLHFGSNKEDRNEENSSSSESELEPGKVPKSIGIKRQCLGVSMREFNLDDSLTNKKKETNIGKPCLSSFQEYIPTGSKFIDEDNNNGVGKDKDKDENENRDEDKYKEKEKEKEKEKDEDKDKDNDKDNDNDKDKNKNKNKDSNRDSNRDRDRDFGKPDILGQGVSVNPIKIRLKNNIPVESIIELRYNKAEQEAIWSCRKNLYPRFGRRSNQEKVPSASKYLPNEDITQTINKHEKRSGVSELLDYQDDGASHSFNFKKHLFAQLQVIGQFNKGFILTKLSVVQGQDQEEIHEKKEKETESIHIFIIDQHASDEKARFEKLNNDLSNIQTQKLITPLAISLSPSQEQLVISYKDIFEKNGFRFIFNQNSEIGSRIQLTQLPVVLGIPLKQIDFLDLLSQINKYKVRVSTEYKSLDFQEPSSIINKEIRGKKKLENNNQMNEDEDEDEEEDSISILTEGQDNNSVTLWCPSGLVPRPRKIWSILASKACRSAVMIGDDLNLPKMKSIVRTMSTLKSPWNCPHGRPSIRHLGYFSTL